MHCLHDPTCMQNVFFITRKFGKILLRVSKTYPVEWVPPGQLQKARRQKGELAKLMTSSLLSSLHCCCQPATDNNGGLSRFYPGTGIGGPITIVSQKLTPQILPCVCTRGGRGGPPGPPIVSRKLGLPLWSRSTVTFRLAVCKIFMLLQDFLEWVGVKSG